MTHTPEPRQCALATALTRHEADTNLRLVLPEPFRSYLAAEIAAMREQIANLEHEVKDLMHSLGEELAETRLIFDALGLHRAEDFGHGTATQAMLERIAALKAAAKPPPGHVTDDTGTVRKVLGTLPLTADGCVVGNGGRFWSPGGTAAGYCMAEDHDEAHWACGECYSTREAAEKAKEGGQ